MIPVEPCKRQTNMWTLWHLVAEVDGLGPAHSRAYPPAALCLALLLLPPRSLGPSETQDS